MRHLKVFGLVAAMVVSLAACGDDTIDPIEPFPAPVGNGPVSPASGSPAGGTVVTITGDNFFSISSVTFDGANAASFTLDSATQITATTPPHAAGPVDVVVTNTGGSATFAYTYAEASREPRITAIAPSGGSSAGGTVVTITGERFTGTTAVTFGGAPATFVVDSAAQITATTPAHEAGAVDVVVTTNEGSTSLTEAFAFADPVIPPSLASLTPSNGSTAGGTTVVLTGAGFIDTSNVTFDGVAATFTVDSETQITVTAPAHNVGSVDVAVTTPNGSATLSGAYTFVTLPTVTSVSPATGPTAGGTALTISGSGFAPGETSVTIAGITIPAGSVSVVSATALAVTTPAHIAGAVDIVVTTAGGSATLPSGFTYAVFLTVTNINPSSVSASGQTGFTLTGSNLTGVTSVSFGGINATSINVVSSTMVTGVTPAHAQGFVDVTVSSPVGSATLANSFTYLATAVGQSTAGGTIAALDGGLNNLIAATADNSSGAFWGSYGILVNATSETDGASNTTTIVNALGAASSAASVCVNYETDSLGNTPCETGNVCYSDWFLPAPSQLLLVYTNRAAIGGFVPSGYWSSRELSNNLASARNFSNGDNPSLAKNVGLTTRCVRAFTP